MQDFLNKKVLVVGAARSGLAAASFLKKMGALVTLTDAKTAEQLGDAVLPLTSQGIKTVWGKDPVIEKGSYDYCVISPGVPLTIPLVEKINNSDIPMIGELELAFIFTKGPVVAITGTNGKTTTSSLTGQIFKDAGSPVFVGGNIGTPLISEVAGFKEDHVIVAEVSSFQLETVRTFRPKVAVIINITPDHLDRHGSMEAYIAAKARVFENQGKEDYTLLNYDDPLVRTLADKTKGQVVFFSRREKLEQGVFLDQGRIVIKWGDKTYDVIEAKDIYIKGGHNLENALAATAAAFCLGVAPTVIKETLMSFPGVAHRLEFVRELSGVIYINDSKGTNPDSTIKALEAYEQPIVLIAGGKNKAGDFSSLAELIVKKVRVLILVGETAPLIKKSVESLGFHNIYQAQDFADTVKLAKSLSQAGDIVLLSPACASWDMFRDFEQRGDLFRQLVNELD